MERNMISPRSQRSRLSVFFLALVVVVAADAVLGARYPRAVNDDKAKVDNDKDNGSDSEIKYCEHWQDCRQHLFWDTVEQKLAMKQVPHA